LCAVGERQQGCRQGIDLRGREVNCGIFNAAQTSAGGGFFAAM